MRSAAAATGFMGVIEVDGTFQASTQRADIEETYLGTYQSAEEAALACVYRIEHFDSEGPARVPRICLTLPDTS